MKIIVEVHGKLGEDIESAAAVMGLDSGAWLRSLAILALYKMDKILLELPDSEV